MFSSDHRFEYAQLEGQSSISRELDWNVCFICQEIGDDSAIISPFKKRGFDKDPTKSSYFSTAENLLEHLKIDGLPACLRKRVENYDTSQELAQEFVCKKAIFHKLCLSMYDKQKLSRKRKQVDTDNKNEVRKIFHKTNTRRSIAALNFTSNCFFCDTCIDNEDLHTCQTLYLDLRVRNIAQEMNDTKLLMKLSEGDMVATEAKYHHSCLIRLYNSFRKHNCRKDEEKDEMVKGIALSEVIEFVKNTIQASNSDITPVFKLIDLIDLYRKKLRFLGAIDAADSIHNTRFKNKLLENIPGLSAVKKGKFIYLTLDGDLGFALFNACAASSYDDGFLLGKVAQMIRKDIFNHDSVFNGDVTHQRQINSVPKSLIHLISLIITGTDVSDESENRSTQTAVNLAQMLKFNTIKKRKKDSTLSRHSKSNEPPLPVYIGMLIHNKTRKRNLVDNLADLGLCIHYDRLQEIQNCITTQLCEEYRVIGSVRPKQFQNDVFTSVAIDNIDSNPSSNTAITSFHGTSISIFQHPNFEIVDQPFIFDELSTANKTVSLPLDYTSIPPAKGGKPEAPLTETSTTFPSEKSVQLEACQWLLNSVSTDHPLEERISFSGYFSSSVFPRTPSKIDLLPLLKDSVNSPAMVKHCMKVAKDIILSLNPNQDPVITADQPVYALGKQIQWMYPNEFKNVVWMMGPLHIEMAFINAIGDWLDGSGWCEVFNKANISTPGRVDSFLKGSHVKRSRYAHQISLLAIYGLAYKAFEQSEIENYADWMKQLRKDSVNADYWFTVIEIETLLFMFIKSLRTADFELFLRCLKDMLPWMFALDHCHYSRWMSVLIRDLENLPMTNPIVFKNFMEGRFVVSKTSKKFSSIGEDQAHEQNNKLVKIDGGAIGILENEKALLNWATSGPVIARIINSINLKNKISDDHHKDTDAFEKRFRDEKLRFLEAFEELGNPFLESSDCLVQIATNIIMDETATDSVRNASIIGKNRCKNFFEQRLLIDGKHSIYEPITKNKLSLFHQQKTIKISKTKQELVSLKSDCKLYANLYVACQVRDGNLDAFFSHENHSYPPAISEYGKLRKCSEKSAFLQCLETIESPKLTEPSVNCIIIDGPAFVHMYPPRSSKTFGEYCNELRTKVESIISLVSRIFSALSVVEQISDEDWQKIQRFVVLLYDRTSPCNMINECRRYLFTKGRMIHLIPPTEDALKQHIKRAMLQSRVWTQALLTEQPAINYDESGWVYSSNTLVPKWMTIPRVYEVCGELIKCRCKTTCSGRCKCRKANLDCTELCLCSGKCVLFSDK